MNERPQIVVATGRDGAIGLDNALPWEGQLPADMKHFRSLTRGKAVIMGRSTWESLPEQFRPLPNRQNIVLSLTVRALEGAQVVRSIPEALDIATSTPMVIGGAQIYELALPYVDTIHATEIETRVPGAHTFFPIRNLRSHEDWVEDSEKTEVHWPDAQNKFIHSFVTYRRRASIIVD